MYVEAEELVRSIGPLLEVVRVMNGTTDMRQRREASIKKTETMQAEMAKVMAAEESADADPKKNADSREHVPDKIHISLMGLRFCHTKPGSQYVISADDFRVPQGSMLAIVGAHGSGKNTLMQILGEVLEPQEGEVPLEIHGSP